MKKLLEDDFECVVPIFPWLSREFGKKSKVIHGNDRFRILVMFPRRPKLSDCGEMYVTINYELTKVRQLGDRYDVPVIAGFPVASNFWELACCQDIAWIDILRVSLYDHLIPISSLGASEVLQESEIVDLAKSCPEHTLKSFETFIRAVRNELPRSFYGSRYKPIYFLLK
jgi:hypothetical protein